MVVAGLKRIKLKHVKIRLATTTNEWPDFRGLSQSALSVNLFSFLVDDVAPVDQKLLFYQEVMGVLCGSKSFKSNRSMLLGALKAMRENMVGDVHQAKEDKNW